MPDLLPRHNKSTKCREGCTRIAIWHAQCDERVVRAYVRISPSSARITNMKFYHILPGSRGPFSSSLKYCACHEDEPEASEVLRLPKVMTMHQNKHDVSFTKRETLEPFKTSSKFTKYYACHKRRPPKAPLISIHACHADDKLTDVLQLPRKPTFQTAKCPERLAPAMKNGHGSKNKHGTQVRTHLRRRNSCAVRVT